METAINQIVMQEINKSARVKAIKWKLTAKQKPKRKLMRLLCMSICVSMYLLQLLLLLSVPYCLQFSLHTIIIIITFVACCTLLHSAHDFMAFHCFAFCNVMQKSQTKNNNKNKSSNNSVACIYICCISARAATRHVCW